MTFSGLLSLLAHNREMLHQKHIIYIEKAECGGWRNYSYGIEVNILYVFAMTILFNCDVRPYNTLDIKISLYFILLSSTSVIVYYLKFGQVARLEVHYNNYPKIAYLL